MATQREIVRHTEYHMQKGRKERHSCIDKVFVKRQRDRMMRTSREDSTN